ncbi:hypothetical protein [Nitrobacter sp.]|uniref:hypothetical protein n=1 Tax=Nitrobacter sp. TaxID=29420 RepID=UPI003F653E59
MTRLPNSLSVSLWGIGVCWIAVAIAYLMDSDMIPIDSLLVSLAVLMLVPLAVIGALGGMTQWPPEPRS